MCWDDWGTDRKRQKGGFFKEINIKYSMLKDRTFAAPEVILKIVTVDECPFISKSKQTSRLTKTFFFLWYTIQAKCWEFTCNSHFKHFVLSQVSHRAGWKTVCEKAAVYKLACLSPVLLSPSFYLCLWSIWPKALLTISTFYCSGIVNSVLLSAPPQSSSFSSNYRMTKRPLSII